MRTRCAWLPALMTLSLVPAAALAQKDPGVVAGGDAVGVVVPREDSAPRPASPKAPPSLLTPPNPKAPPADNVIWLTPDRKRGGYTWKGAGFRARINADGELSFEDQRVGLKFINPLRPRPNPYAVPSVQSKLAGREPRPAELSEVVPRPEETLNGYQQPYLADPRYGERRGKEMLDYGSNVPIVMVGASFDLTDELARLGGEDPYRYDKARFAASTRDFRGKLSARARGRATKEACGRLREQLTALAVSPPPDAGAFGRAINALEGDLDGATEEGRLLRGYLDGLKRDGHVDRGALTQPWNDDDPRLCGLVARPAAKSAASGAGGAGATKP